MTIERPFRVVIVGAFDPILADMGGQSCNAGIGRRWRRVLRLEQGGHLGEPLGHVLGFSAAYTNFILRIANITMRSNNQPWRQRWMFVSP